jgi:hypothetical protein
VGLCRGADWKGLIVAHIFIAITSAVQVSIVLLQNRLLKRRLRGVLPLAHEKLADEKLLQRVHLREGITDATICATLVSGSPQQLPRCRMQKTAQDRQALLLLGRLPET